MYAERASVTMVSRRHEVNTNLLFKTLDFVRQFTHRHIIANPPQDARQYQLDHRVPNEAQAPIPPPPNAASRSR